MSDPRWTVDDLADVNQAIKELAIGKRLTRVTFSGSNGLEQTNEYAPVELPQLQALRQDIAAELAAAGGDAPQ